MNGGKLRRPRPVGRAAKQDIAVPKQRYSRKKPSGVLNNVPTYVSCQMTPDRNVERCSG